MTKILVRLPKEIRAIMSAVEIEGCGRGVSKGGSGGWSTPLSSDRTTVHYLHDANMVTPQHPLATLSHKPWPYS